MRQLTQEEIYSVSGGFGFVGAGIGGAIGLGSALYNGATPTGVLAATALGAASGLTGNLASSAAAGGMVLRSSWAIRSVGHGIAGSVASGKIKEEDS